MRSRTRVITVAVLLAGALVGCGSSGTGTAPAKPGQSQSAGAKGSSGSGPKPSPPARSSAGTGWVPADAAIADVCRGKLPSQAQDTLVLIAKGGPYPYRSDGIVFENRENRLPREKAGYYHEYTVVTPGSDDRGTRRIVTGSSGEQYWTGDHYDSFQEIDPRC